MSLVKQVFGHDNYANGTRTTSQIITPKNGTGGANHLDNKASDDAIDIDIGDRNQTVGNRIQTKISIYLFLLITPLNTSLGVDYELDNEGFFDHYGDTTIINYEKRNRTLFTHTTLSLNETLADNGFGADYVLDNEGFDHYDDTNNGNYEKRNRTLSTHPILSLNETLVDNGLQNSSSVFIEVLRTGVVSEDYDNDEKSPEEVYNSTTQIDKLLNETAATFDYDFNHDGDQMDVETPTVYTSLSNNWNSGLIYNYDTKSFNLLFCALFSQHYIFWIQQ